MRGVGALPSLPGIQPESRGIREFYADYRDLEAAISGAFRQPIQGFTNEDAATGMRRSGRSIPHTIETDVRVIGGLEAAHMPLVGECANTGDETRAVACRSTPSGDRMTSSGS